MFASVGGRQSCLRDLSLDGAENTAHAHDGQIRAPMAGRLVAVQVAAGQTVRKGAPLLVLEAMKMEHPSLAPMDARVDKVWFEAGAQVNADALLMELVAAPNQPQPPNAG